MRLVMCYVTQNRKEFVCGGKDEHLVCHSKGLLRSTTKDLCHSEGEILNIKWMDKYIAWATTLGVSIYDTDKKQIIFTLQLYTPEQVGLSILFPFILTWRHSTDLFVGNYNRILHLHISETSDETGSRVSIVHEINGLDYIVCGLEPFLHHMAILGAYISDQTLSLISPPDLHLVRLDSLPIGNCSLEQLEQATFLCDQISLDSEGTSCRDFHLSSLSSSIELFILSPTQLVTTDHISFDDHLSWLLHTGHYHEALSDAINVHPSEHTTTSVDKIASEYLGSLLHDENWSEAVTLAKEHLRSNPPLFQSLIVAMIHANTLDLLGDIPINDPQLDARTYEMILRYYFVRSPRQFTETIQKIPPTLYDANVILGLFDEADGFLLELESIRSRLLNFVTSQSSSQSTSFSNHTLNNLIQEYSDIAHHSRLRSDFLDVTLIEVGLQLKHEREMKEQAFLSIRMMLLERLVQQQESPPSLAPLEESTIISSNPFSLHLDEEDPFADPVRFSGDSLSKEELAFVRHEIVNGALGGLPITTPDSYLQSYSRSGFDALQSNRKRRPHLPTCRFSTSQLDAIAQEKEAEAQSMIIELLFNRKQQLGMDFQQHQQKYHQFLHFLALTSGDVSSDESTSTDTDEWTQFTSLLQRNEQYSADQIPLLPPESARRDGQSYFMLHARELLSFIGSVISSFKQYLNSLRSSQVVIYESLRLSSKAFTQRVHNHDTSIFDRIATTPSDLSSNMSLLPQLAELDESRTISLLSATDTEGNLVFPINSVLKSFQQTQSSPFIAHYFETLFKRNHKLCEPFADVIIPAFASHCPQMLIPLLRQTTTYTLTAAIKTCEERRLFTAKAFLYSHNGSPREAMEVYLCQLRDIPAVVDVCTSVKDPQLYKHLFLLASQPQSIARMTKQPTHSTAASEILVALHDFIDPHFLIQSIPSHVIIVPLKPVLVHSLTTLRMNSSVLQNTLNATHVDQYALTSTLRIQRRKGVRIPPSHTCHICASVITSRSSLYNPQSIISFPCGHVAHLHCLRAVLQEREANGMLQSPSGVVNHFPHLYQCILCKC
ncbi:putative Vacuolar protein sorting-associated protein 41 like protein [Blattamonas nauphoetae]|uniref:Vacuolar protein sorting-associated protein 41 like protein n=1 Tax=Blattamonas nauphoetae TaxID=2049346 RepID=A0ABQ9XMV7_9EUKA|nr:putative Vacuolar protein sorting-associated protein 41 like protein [Blattamonas nauphoetae]